MSLFEQIIIANWKMQLDLEESKMAARSFKNILAQADVKKNIQVVVCPDFLAWSEVAKILKDSQVVMGAQDAFYEAKGAYTGQISMANLKNLGCQYVILGHSERRALGESNELINQKVKAALVLGITPIICVGETFEERQDGSKGTVIMHQIYEALKNIEIKPGNNIIIAYEPVWVIGSGQAISGEEASHTAAMIRQNYIDAMDGQNMEALRIIYGGSVDADNIRQFTGLSNISGALVGSASLKPKVFADLIKNA